MNRIEKITKNKQDFMEILLIADPSKKTIESYLGDSDLFVMYENSAPVCAAAVLKVTDDTCELKNIAATKMRRGYGSSMIDYICDYYKDKYKYMEIGTGSTSIGNIEFYKRKGFEFMHRMDNFFIDNYDEPIFEDGLQCKHMVMFKKSFIRIEKLQLE